MTPSSCPQQTAALSPFLPSQPRRRSGSRVRRAGAGTGLVCRHHRSCARSIGAGAKFTVAELLGPCGAGGVAPLFDGGSLVVARLAPQDFHRWRESGELARWGAWGQFAHPVLVPFARCPCGRYFGCDCTHRRGRVSAGSWRCSRGCTHWVRDLLLCDSCSILSCTFSAALSPRFVENKRAVVLLHTHRFGVVALVAVGSTMASSNFHS